MDSIMIPWLDSIQFFVKQVKKYGDSVLELACGTREIAIPIAKTGNRFLRKNFSSTKVKIKKKN